MENLNNKKDSNAHIQMTWAIITIYIQDKSSEKFKSNSSSWSGKSSMSGKWREEKKLGKKKIEKKDTEEL